jgi:hypothetical protein
MQGQGDSHHFGPFLLGKRFRIGECIMSEVEKITEFITPEYEKNIDDFIDSFRRPIILREDVYLVKPKALANHDCAKTGPAGKFLIGGKVAYPAESLRVWLKKLSSSTWRGTKVTA